MNALERNQVWAVVEEAREVAPSIFEARFRAPRIAASARPGQFVHVRVDKGLDPLLRRPLSIGAVAGGSIDLLFRRIGRGTRRLSLAVPGESYDFLGPLGNPFTLLPKRPAVMVAGGLGIAVFPFLTMRLKAEGCRDLHVIYGARTKSELVWADRLEALGARMHVTTDDGTAGHHGLCTEILGKVLSSADSAPAIYACGPEPMFQGVLAEVRDITVPIQLCYEQRMGCGIGACLACVVKTNQGYLRSCTEGPVLDGSLFR